MPSMNAIIVLTMQNAKCVPFKQLLLGWLAELAPRIPVTPIQTPAQTAAPISRAQKLSVVAMMTMPSMIDNIPMRICVIPEMINLIFYSKISLNRTPSGPKNVELFSRCPL